MNTETTSESREENYFIPMTDLLIGILFIFIIIIMAIIFNITELEDLNKTELEKNAGLLSQIRELQLKNKDMKLDLQALQQLIDDLKKTISGLESHNSSLSEQLALEKDAHEKDIEALQLRINLFLARSNYLRKEMLRKIQDRLKKYGYPTTVDEENGILRLADNVLFQSGEYELSQQGTSVLNVLARVLEEVLPEYAWHRSPNADGLVCSKSACLEAIYVEGHTDKRPIQRDLKGGIRTNLQLSAARADTTFQTLVTHEKLNSLVNGRNEKLLGVSGYGESRPIRHGENDEDLRANRRIDLRFLMSSPNLEQAFQ